MSESESAETMIHFKCPNCESDIAVDPQHSGTESTCPQCTHRIMVPPTSFEEPNSRKVSVAVHEVFDEGDESAVTIAQIMAEKKLDGGVELGEGGSGNKLTHRYLSSDNNRRYQVGDIVGAGGMGAILAARDMNIWRHVAMKVMLKKEKVSNSELLRFLEEAQVTGQLEHPNIVPVHELGVDSSGNVYYTMKLIRGTSLKDVITKIKEGDEETIREYPLNRLINIYLKLCDAVAFAHSKGVIHRDLKPENIMIGDYGEVLVLDWGLAKIIGVDRDDEELASSNDEDSKPEWMTEDVDSFRKSDEALQTMTGTVLGTPSFMAPEQAHAQADGICFQTDVYALGGILYNILTLSLPIQAKSVNLLLMALITGKLTPPQDWNPDGEKAKERVEKGKPPIDLAHCPNRRVPNSLAAVAMKALALTPEDRYPEVKALQADIEAWQAGFATAAENASLWRQIVLLVSRHKREFALAGSAALILVVVTTVFMIGLKLSRDAAVTAQEKEAVQRKRAEGLLVEVEAEKKLAIEAKDLAERQLYYANIAFVQDCLDGDPVRPVLAERKLAECPQNLRGFEWRYLKSRLQSMGRSTNIGGWRKPGSWDRRVCITRTGGKVYLLVDKGISSPITMIVQFTRKRNGWSRKEYELGRGVVGFDLAMDRTEKYLVVRGHSTYVIEADSMKPILTTESKGVGRVAFVDGSKGVAGFMPSTMSSGLEAGCIVDVRRGKVLESLSGIGFSRSATGNIVCYPYLPICKQRKVVVRTLEGKELWSVPCSGRGASRAVESPDGRCLAVARAGKLSLYSQGGRLLVEHTFSSNQTGVPEVLCFSPDSGSLCVSGKSVGKTLLMDIPRRKWNQIPVIASRASFNPMRPKSGSGNYMALASRNNVYLVDTDVHRVVQTIQGHDSDIIALGFGDDAAIVSVSGERILRSTISPKTVMLSGVFLNDGRIFNGRSAKTLAPGANHVANSGNMVAGQGRVAAWDQTTIRIQDTGSDKVVTFPLSQASVGVKIEHVSFSRSGELLFVGVRRAKVRSLAAYRSLTGESLWEIPAPVFPLFGFAEGMTELDEILHGSSFVRIADLSNGKRDREAILQSAKQKVGRKYRVSLGAGMYNVIRVKGNTRRMYVKSNMVSRGLVAMNPQETLGAFVANETDVTVHDLTTAKQLRELKGTREKINSICMSPSGLRIATFDRDNRIRIWDTETGREIVAFAVPKTISRASRIRFLDPDQLLLIDSFGKQMLMKAGVTDD